MTSEDIATVEAERRERADGDADTTAPGRLLTSRRFAPLFFVQALGAFNDNAFKTAFVALMTYLLVADLEMSIEVLAPIASAIFIIPFAFLAPFAGQIADRVDKAKMMRWVKFAEIILMIGAAAGYILQSVPLLFLILFLMGAQSAFFSPIKYGVLPQYLRPYELVRGNGFIQAATFVAILGGSIVGANLVLTSNGALIVSGLVIVIAIIGWIASLYAPPAPSSLPPPRASSVFDGSLHLRRVTGGALRAQSVLMRFSVFAAIWAVLAYGLDLLTQDDGPLSALSEDRPILFVGSAVFMQILYWLWPSIVDSLNSARKAPTAFDAVRAIAWFWFVGATYLAILPVLASVQLGGDETVFTLLLAAFSIGVGIGSVITGLLYRGGAKVGFAPWGAVGIAFFSIELALAIEPRPEGAVACERIFVDGVLTDRVPGSCIDAVTFLSTWSGWRVLIDFVCLAAFAGVYLTPLNAVYQAEAPPEARGRVVACSNMIDSTFMALSSVAIVLLGLAQLAPQEILGLIGGTGLLAALVVARWAPETFLGKIARRLYP